MAAKSNLILTPTSRRAFLGRSLAIGGATLLGGSALLTACGDDDDSAEAGGGGSGASGDLTKVSTVFSWVKNVEWAGFWVGDAEGYYADEGITGHQGHRSHQPPRRREAHRPHVPRRGL